MKLVVNNLARIAILAEYPSEAVKRLNAAYMVYKLFPGAEELAVLQSAAYNVQLESRGRCEIRLDI